MKEKELIDIWKREESVAHIHGWDFSHIEGRYTEETDLPWNYQNIILDYLKPEMKLLDIDTGGGEFLLSLRHPYVKTSATEAYPPNIQLCKETLLLFLTVSKNKIAATPENIGVVAILTVVLNYSILFPSFTFFLDGFHLAFGDKFEICIKTTDLM